MQYRNSEMKLDQLIGYFNDGKISLIPPFQRGHVWKLPMRQRLMENIVNGRPIPAIFLYKEAVGSKYTYNILDGKQRLESLILFIGGKRDDVKINGLNNYFYNTKDKAQANFPININKSKVTFSQLSEQVVADFREYSIATIEISLTDVSLDEIITLFIDINQSGVKVNRFDIVKAMAENPLLESMFDLIAQKQNRRNDVFYKKKQTAYVKVLDRLQIMQNLPDPTAKVDRMWERMLEFSLFCRTKKHRIPAQILKTFIHSDDENEKAKLTPVELKKLNACFQFLAKAYSKYPVLSGSKFATDQTHFYTMVTSLLFDDLTISHNGVVPDTEDLMRRLVSFAKIIEDKARPPATVAAAVSEYREASTKQTTHVGQRGTRQTKFLEILSQL